ncbi:hypothetical protein D3C80_2108560 [compost metagenome]
MPRPNSGSRPSSQTTGSRATTSDTRVIFSERQYSQSSTAVMTKAIRKKPITSNSPSTTSPTSLE